MRKWCGHAIHGYLSEIKGGVLDLIQGIVGREVGSGGFHWQFELLRSTTLIVLDGTSKSVLIGKSVRYCRKRYFLFGSTVERMYRSTEQESSLANTVGFCIVRDLLSIQKRSSGKYHGNHA